MTRSEVLLLLEKVPAQLRAIPQWEALVQMTDSIEVPVNCRTGAICYGPGFGMPFAQALEFFLDHQDVVGLFLRILPGDDWHELRRIGVEAGGRYGFTPFLPKKKTHRSSGAKGATGFLFTSPDASSGQVALRKVGGPLKRLVREQLLTEVRR